MHALILSSLLAGQNCPGGVCPVPARANAPAFVVVTQTPAPPLATVPRGTVESPRFVPVLGRQPVRTFVRGSGPVRNAVRRLFR